MTNKEAKEKLYMEWQKFLEDNIDYAGISDAYKTAFKALEQEPCDDAVNRQAALDCLTATKLKKFDFILQAREEIKKLPPVIPQTKTGHWFLLDECSNSGYYCSECRKKVVKEGWSGTVKKIKFCPNCGAKMQEVGG